MKKLKNIAACTILSVAIITFLEVKHASTSHDNGFYRIIKPNGVQLDKTIKLKASGYYFGGTSNSHIYLANAYNKGELVETDYQLSSVSNYRLEMTFPSDMLMPYSTFHVDSPFVFIAEGIHPYLILESLFDFKKKVDLCNHIRFNLFVPLTNSSFVVRNLDSASQQNILQKSNTDSPASIRTYLLRKYGDGFFSTDGTLLYNKKSGLICYVYRYRNAFDCLDTNLTLLATGRTIDTTSVPHIEVENIVSDRIFTFATPPIYVNKHAAMSDSLLVIQSGLKASTENTTQVNGNSVFDVYDLKSTRYLYSFYIQKYNGETVQDVVLHESTLMVLYKHYISSYHLD